MENKEQIASLEAEGKLQRTCVSLNT
jgi:hypothetical protein